VSLLYAKSDTALAEVHWPDPAAPQGRPIIMELADWRGDGLFHRAVFRHGTSRWDYRYTILSPAPRPICSGG
jgi:hypothetical protein